MSGVETGLNRHLIELQFPQGLAANDGQATTVRRHDDLIRDDLIRLDGDVQRFAAAVRSHRSRENPLDWCLDMACDEDQSRIRTGHAPENMTLVRQIALNLLTQEDSVKVGKKA